MSLADDLTVLDRGHQGYGGDVGAQWDRVDPKTKALTGANLHLVLLLSLSAPSCQIQSACRTWTSIYRYAPSQRMRVTPLAGVISWSQ